MKDYTSRVIRTLLQASVPVVAAIGTDLGQDGEISKTGLLIAVGAGLTVVSSGLNNLADFIKEKYGHSE